MRQMCQAYGEDRRECDRPAVDYVELLNRVWMCAEHWDDFKNGKPVYENPLKTRTQQ